MCGADMAAEGMCGHGPIRATQARQTDSGAEVVGWYLEVAIAILISRAQPGSARARY